MIFINLYLVVRVVLSNNWKQAILFSLSFNLHMKWKCYYSNLNSKFTQMF